MHKHTHTHSGFIMRKLSLTVSHLQAASEPLPLTHSAEDGSPERSVLFSPTLAPRLVCAVLKIKFRRFN